MANISFYKENDKHNNSQMTWTTIPVSEKKCSYKSNALIPKHAKNIKTCCSVFRKLTWPKTLKKKQRKRCETNRLIMWNILAVAVKNIIFTFSDHFLAFVICTPNSFKFGKVSLWMQQHATVCRLKNNCITYLTSSSDSLDFLGKYFALSMETLLKRRWHEGKDK